MSLPLWFTTDPLVHAIGLALLHGVWQGAAVGGVAAIALRATDPAAAGRRHAILMGALAAQAGLLALTVVLVHDGGASGVAAATDPADWVVRGADPTPVGEGVSRRVSAAFHGARPLLPWVVALWVAGVTVSATRIVVGIASAVRLREEAVAARPRLVERARRLAARIGLRRAFRLRTTDAIDTPAAVGWWRPAVLLPRGLVDGRDEAELDALLLHELVHLKRRDDFVAVLQAAASAALFHHPCAGWLSRRLISEREHRCDDQVAAACSGNVIPYVRALIGLEEGRARLAASTLHAATGSLARRVRRLVEPSGRASASRLAVGIAGSIAIGLAIVWSQLVVVPAVPATPPGWATIRAMDDAGRFTVVIEAGRVSAVTIEGEVLPPERFAHERDSLYVLDAAGTPRFAARVRSEGGIDWRSRPPGWSLEGP